MSDTGRCSILWTKATREGRQLSVHLSTGDMPQVSSTNNKSIYFYRGGAGGARLNKNFKEGINQQETEA